MRTTTRGILMPRATTAVFTNEIGNRILMHVEKDSRKGITISAVGPTSTVEHTWTPKEVSVLIKLLSDVGVKKCDLMTQKRKKFRFKK
jgi:hypothetical protein